MSSTFFYNRLESVTFRIDKGSLFSIFAVLYFVPLDLMASSGRRKLLQLAS